MTHEEFARMVRPYAVTGGRVRPARADLPLEALVTALDGTAGRALLTPEKRGVLLHSAHTFVSVAELSALLSLPLGVTRIVVGDMADDGLVDVHTSAPLRTDARAATEDLALSLHLLESVLDGISAL